METRLDSSEKNKKKLGQVSLIFSLVFSLVFSICVGAFASETTPYSQITNDSTPALIAFAPRRPVFADELVREFRDSHKFASLDAKQRFTLRQDDIIVRQDDIIDRAKKINTDRLQKLEQRKLEQRKLEQNYKQTKTGRGERDRRGSRETGFDDSDLIFDLDDSERDEENEIDY